MRLGWPTWVDHATSTQVTLVEQARAGVVSQVLATTSQTGGRGRRGREWTCPPGAGLAMSVLVRLPRQDGWSWLPLLAGVAVHEALTDLGAPPSLGLKWPNDVRVDAGAGAGKLAGIIAERVDAPAGADPALVLGIGINLQRALLPPEATALDALGVRAASQDVASSVLDTLGAWLDRWAADPRDVAAPYRQRCLTLGQEVRVHLPGGDALTGTAAAVDQEGRLVLDTASGPVPLSAGDVVHLRPG
jgi:BirA family biotin operon repressor/biotin-[acetyl-CoA-carboxylase] ligase